MIATLRALLAVALLAGLCLIPAVLVFSVLFLVLFFNYIATGSPAPSVYYLIFVMPGLWALLYTVFMLLGVTGTPRDASEVVNRDQAPVLWDRVDRLARRVGTRPPAELRLTAQANAGVVEESRWLGLIPVTRRMYLGIPLLYTLPPGQLDAVICHELGHYSRGHTRAGAVCYRAHVAANLMVDGLAMVRARRDPARRRRVVNRVVNEAHYQLVHRYTEVYRRLSAATTQSQEFQADAKAAEITGAPTTADALHAAHAVIAGWGMFTKSRKGFLQLAGGTSDPFTEFRDKWKDPGFRQAAALAAAGQVHDPFSTHPPLQERLARLIPGRVQAGAADSWPAPAAPPAEAPEIPLNDSELARLFIDEADIKRKRETPRVVPHEPAAKGVKAILGLLLRLLISHPFAAGAAAVIVLAGTVSGAYEGHQHARPYGAFVPVVKLPDPPSLGVPGSAGLPSASPLAGKLTGYLQTRNESGFLSLATPAARTAMRSWWANQQAMGFTTGAIVPASPTEDTVHVNSTGNGTATILAGTHNPFDPAGDRDDPPAVPATEYRIGLHLSRSSPDAVGQITSWTPLSDAPWDQGTPLSVRKSAHVEVVGGPGDTALVSQTLPLAETAATYDLALISHVNPHLNDQTGFVVFVSASASDRKRWFRSGPQPKEQTGDADAGVTYLLNGPAAGCGPDNLTSACGSDVSMESGGARIVITPYQQAGETPQQETSVLVREMIHAMYIPAQNVGLASGVNVPTWANEGFARVIADLYQADGNPAPASYDFRQVITAVQALPGSYRTGTLPGAQQLYGENAASRAGWDAVAASVYAYISEKYGMRQMLASAGLLGWATDTPFGNVLESDKNGTFTFYPASTISSGWRKWLQDPR
jgi:Zn-dependent protease with chaperone function